MRFDYHPDLIERAVFVVARREAPLECELHAAVDRLFEIPDQELRQQAFNQAYGELFRRWKLDSVLCNAVEEFPLVDRGMDHCFVAPAARGKTQAVDLFVKQADAPGAEPVRTLLIQLCPEAYLQTDQTSIWLRRELYHVADMLDADFGYSPQDLDGSSWECNTRRDRYQVLWRSYVLGRLIRSGRADELELPALKNAFRRAFTYHGLQPSDEDFTRVLNEPTLTHRQLFSWANRAELVVHARKEQCLDSPGKMPPGGECPLCGFPTYDWYVFSTENDEGRAEAIEATKPSWRTEQGACRQCVETIAARTEGGSVNATSSVALDGGKNCEQEQMSADIMVV